MAIIKRVVTGGESGWNYSVESPRFTAYFLERSAKVVNASPVIHWAIGQRLDKVRETCSQRGWQLNHIGGRGKR